jgi:L-lysine 2,3-aminomutase
VLLAGVNDDAAVLAELSRRLFACGALPYYLHQLDRVAGAAHFAVGDAQAIALHAQLIAMLPGYLVPRLVRELAGAPGKTPLHAVAAQRT